jgi:large subunit ribosomal protein L1
MTNINTPQVKLNKNARLAHSLVEPTPYKLDEAVNLLKDTRFSYAKFDQTVELALNLGVDPRHADQIVQGTVKLPAGTGQKIRVAVFCKPGNATTAALEAGADAAGINEDLINDIKQKIFNFDVYIATPDTMGDVAQVARYLGPKGLMPNPKHGTVTNDIATAVKDAKGGKVKFRVDKSSIVHTRVGKVSFSQEDLISNIETFIDAVKKAKPSGARGTYIKSVHLAASMTPGIKVDIGGATVKKQL